MRKNIEAIPSITGKILGYIQLIKFENIESEIFSFHHVLLDIEGDFFNSWNEAYDAFLAVHNSYYH